MYITSKAKVIFIILIAAMSYTASLSAEQLHFDRRVGTTEIEYDYTFTSPSGRIHKISFKLDRNLSEASKVLFNKTGKHELDQRTKQVAKDLFHSLQAEYIERARNKFDSFINEQTRVLPAGISIQNLNKGENIRASSDGSMPRAQAESIIDDFLQAMHIKWQELNQEYLEDFEVEVAKRTQKYYIDSYKQNYYIASFSTPANKSFKLRIDFDQVAQLHANALKPVADAIAANTRGLTRREVLNYTSYFIQSIPYDTLNSRDAHDETGFVAPLTLFDINKGDCDTKSTALAAILSNLYPELDIKMVLIPNHAFLAVYVEGQAEDTTILYHDKEYAVLEAAGPALTPVGESYESSFEHMQANPGKIGRIIPLLQGTPG